MAGFSGYLSASLTTQKSQMVCFLYFYLGDWLFRGLEVNRRKLGLMVSDTIIFLFCGHVSNGNAHNKDEMKAKHIFSCTDHLIDALITPLS